MGTGTGSAWLHISYTDGPTESAVRQFAVRYQGSQFNGMTDMYDLLEDQLIAFDGEPEPEQVGFVVDGILEQRSYSLAAWLHAQHLVTKAGHPEIQVCNPDGEPINDGPVPEWVSISDKVYTNLYSPAGLALNVLRTLDLAAQ